MFAALAAVAALAAFVVAPPAPQASHATDGELLAWVESYDAFDVSAGLVDAAVGDRPSVAIAEVRASTEPAARASLANDPPPPSVTGTCRAFLLSGVPAPDTIGCELPKTAGDLPELEPPGAVAAASPSTRRDPIALASDPSPRQAPLQRPLRPPSA